METDGVPVATLYHAVSGERAQVNIDGQPWIMASARGEISATDPARVPRHRAHRVGFLPRHWTANLDGRSVVHLESAGSRHWRLRNAEGTAVLGQVRVNGLFRPRVLAELPDATSTDVAVFVLWLTFVLDRRRRNAASGGGG